MTPNPDELYMYELTTADREKVVNVLSDMGLHIKYCGTLITDTSNLTFLPSTGYWYPPEVLGVCACCGKSYIRNTLKDECVVYSDAEGKELSFCSTVCAKDAGYIKTAEGEWIFVKEANVQYSKAHYKASTHISEASEEHPFLIGLEIEKEDPTSWEAMYHGDGLHCPKGWLYVHDGSLSNCGLELVSHGYNLTKEKKEMLDAMDSCADFINGASSNRCGGHISISEFGKSSEELAKEILPMVAFMLTLFPNRMQNSKINKLNFQETISLTNSKYKPLQLDKNGRVELRMLSRVRSVKSLKRRIEVIQWFLENKPTFRQTKKAMQNGFLKEIMSAVYGSETWLEKTSIFSKMSLWYCWNVDPQGIDTVIADDS